MCKATKPIEDFHFTDKFHSARRHNCKKCRNTHRDVKSKLLKDARYRAKKKNLEFNLSYDDIQIPDLCPVFQTPLQVGGRLDAPSLDRIDNSKGYTKENVIIVSFRANQFKNSATIEELKQIVCFYEELMAHK